ncbi:MAG: hypothetical protein MUQ30_11305 [Anaerolineae bacterium]|nr:hypothetical protein [Anaerolineae bacterium]
MEGARISTRTWLVDDVALFTAALLRLEDEDQHVGDLGRADQRGMIVHMWTGHYDDLVTLRSEQPD